MPIPSIYLERYQPLVHAYTGHHVSEALPSQTYAFTQSHYLDLPHIILPVIQQLHNSDYSFTDFPRKAGNLTLINGRKKQVIYSHDIKKAGELVKAFEDMAGVPRFTPGNGEPWIEGTRSEEPVLIELDGTNIIQGYFKDNSPGPFEPYEILIHIYYTEVDNDQC